jgi:hypothetical protein
MARWGRGRFQKWKDEAYEICSEHPDGIPMESILANSKLGERKKPMSVKHGTELLKRDSRFESHYQEKGRYNMTKTSHRKVLQWTVIYGEE